jgi:probable rRNA maturation factor
VIKLTVVNGSGRAVPKAFLATWVKSMAKAADRRGLKGFKNKVLVIAFVDPIEARRLNREFRRRDYATDVLSFDAIESESLGELVICPQVISKQAREHGLLVREELGYMVLHGFLHLLGFDHEKSKRDAQRMFAIQDGIFDEMLVLMRRA